MVTAMVYMEVQNIIRSEVAKIVSWLEGITPGALPGEHRGSAYHVPASNCPTLKSTV